MENYLDKLFSLHPEELEAPKTTIPYGELLKLIPIKDPTHFEKALKDLTRGVPFQTGSWPSFGNYVEDWYMVELSEFCYNLRYCERGGTDLRSKCENIIDLVFETLRIVAPLHTQAASTLAAGLDRLADQRLLIWLRMSSEIYHMYQVNEYFGLRVAVYNVQWMCEELVRMGVFLKGAEAFESKEHILKGLTISGMPKPYASGILQQLMDS